MPNPTVGTWVDCDKCDYNSTCEKYKAWLEQLKLSGFCQQRCK